MLGGYAVEVKSTKIVTSVAPDTRGLSCVGQQKQNSDRHPMLGGCAVKAKAKYNADENLITRGCTAK